ncbi:MAG: DNA-binding response regulator [Candidatus Amulumruptor caecigallinarius]|uniref:Response regulator transcription factor n=1 Tax=Candidatus Amulumruptor caecigallinarius TaxID=2109911 RepID=A0A4Q0UB48_9BACT|nr:MAG: DNA-binding response regulator [Candidatus Amulumruptor caecigallinarius]HJE38626.1 response regulator transcription factor [Candidatus Amulumruptor caecigallinarius]
MSAKILLIDDEEPICEILKYNLERVGYEVDCAYSAEEALELDLRQYSLCLVDIMMERLSGYDFAKAVRNNPEIASLPLIFCSALNGEDDAVMGLNIGGDDYITKPFVISEVVARVRAVLRRSAMRPADNSPKEDGRQDANTVSFGGISVDLDDKVCTLDGVDLNLTKTELELMTFFLTHRNRIYSREEIIKQIWPDDVIVTTRAIDTNIARLRKKLGRYGNNIVTRMGFGYGFKETE